MDLNFTAAEQAFREEARAFLRASVPPETREKMLGGVRVPWKEFARWQHILHAHGWGAPNWPKEFGGPGGARWSSSSSKKKQPTPALPASRRSGSRW